MIALILSLLLQGPPDARTDIVLLGQGPVPVTSPGPPDERSFDHLIDLVPTPPMCVKREEILGFIDLHKVCNDRSFSLMVNPNSADEVLVKIYYWDFNQPRKLLRKKISLPVQPGTSDTLIATPEFVIDPAWVKSIEITLSRKATPIEHQKFHYASHAPRK